MAVESIATSTTNVPENNDYGFPMDPKPVFAFNLV